MREQTPLLVNAGELPAPAGHYSHAAIAGGMVYVSGLLPATSEGKLLSAEPFEQQAGQVLRNLDAVLASAGSKREQLVQVRVYIADVEHWGAFNRLYADWIGTHRPARCVVPVPALHYGVALEVEAVALAT
jgi:reactive intermediate/imine deaminase